MLLLYLLLFFMNFLIDFFSDITKCILVYINVARKSILWLGIDCFILYILICVMLYVQSICDTIIN